MGGGEKTETGEEKGARGRGEIFPSGYVNYALITYFNSLPDEKRRLKNGEERDAEDEERTKGKSEEKGGKRCRRRDEKKDFVLFNYLDFGLTGGSLPLSSLPPSFSPSLPPSLPPLSPFSPPLLFPFSPNS